MKLLKLVALCCLVVTAFTSKAQVYPINLPQSTVPVINGFIKTGSHRAPDGSSLNANNLYFTKNGKPWYPVMGEIHFSRYPKAKWEEAILKMKAAGIDVIASYVFWIYHEEEEGQFDWTGNKDVRAFAELCKKNGVYFFARIGPWCHGEVRNGGFPDWVVKRGNLRSNDPGYLELVQKLYNEIGKQLKGLCFKDGGPLIGCQIENEFRFDNPKGLKHVLMLKKMAIEAGLDVPYYTATGWPGSNKQQNELIPVWGAYPGAPWDKHITELPLSENYLFNPLRNDPSIGSDLFGKQDAQSDFKGYHYPYGTAEMGGGNQITYHRRPIIKARDVTALSYTKIGSGANMMGYYMFHGGSNAIGKLSTLQESKPTKYPNDYPIINYDFLAPIGEWGQLRESYREFKTIHTFLNEFGDRLATYYPVFPEQKPSGPADSSTLRFSVRSKNGSGFIFINNYQRHYELPDHNGIQFRINSANGSLLLPAAPIQIKKGVQAILPFNMDLGGINLKYSTAQPFCRINGRIPLYTFFAPEGMRSEFLISRDNVKMIQVENGSSHEDQENFLVSGLKPGTSCLIKLTQKNGRSVYILTLTAEQAKNAWKASLNGVEHLFISNQELTFTTHGIDVQSERNPVLKFSAYPAIPHLKSPYLKAHVTEGIFTSYMFKLPNRQTPISVNAVTDISSFTNKGILLPWDDRDSTNNAATGPQYQTNLVNVKGAIYYAITLPPVVKDLNETYLKIDYTGDTGSIYLNGRLIADDFYSGLPMMIGVKRWQTAQPVTLLLQIVPLDKDKKIYFEKSVENNLKGDRMATLKSVSAVPKYELKITVD